MRHVAPKAVLSARYMTRFRCLAGDCEATCCGGGAIPVEESNHRRLTLLADGDAEATALLAAGIELTPNGPDFARIRFSDSGDCSMRDDQGLCRVHARFGHEALFSVCATFPRYASEVDEDVELFGTLACPEVARLALLADDAFELAHLTLDEEPRVLRNRFNTDSPYYKPFKPLRAALIRLLSEADYALADKLFVMLWMADKLKAVVHRSCVNVPATELETALAVLSEPQALNGLSASFRALSLDGALPLSVIVAALRPPVEPRRGAQTDGFDAMWLDLEGRYGAALRRGHVATPSEVQQLWARYQGLCAAVPEDVSARIDLCLSRYAINHVLTTPYMLSANLFEYAYDLTVRLACLRFLMCSRLTEPASAAKVDESIVRTTYCFVRTVEHSELPGQLRQALPQQGLDGLAHAVCFLALWTRGSR